MHKCTPDHQTAALEHAEGGRGGGYPIVEPPIGLRKDDNQARLTTNHPQHQLASLVGVHKHHTHAHLYTKDSAMVFGCGQCLYCYLPGLGSVLGVLGFTTNTLIQGQNSHHHHQDHNQSTVFFKQVLTLAGTVAIAIGLVLEYLNQAQNSGRIRSQPGLEATSGRDERETREEAKAK